MARPKAVTNEGQHKAQIGTDPGEFVTPFIPGVYEFAVICKKRQPLLSLISLGFAEPAYESWYSCHRSYILLDSLRDAPHRRGSL